MGVEQWANENNFNGDIAYFFEAGHAYQPQANKLMNAVFKSEYFNRKFRYGSHTFVDKTKARPIQSADILAWQAATDIKRALSGFKARRADYLALLQTDTLEFLGTADIFREFRERQQTRRMS